MQKLRRVYLGNCGFRTAWFDGLVLPMTDPVTGEPADTILHLENGGGKTTLLGLIMSCFETEQSRFLKHLQKNTTRFSQYFDQQGLPGVIAVEWLMPSRDLAEGPYHLITGQVITVRGSNDSVDVERQFFAFREQPGVLALEDIPAPSLGATPALSMAEFSRWMHEAQGRSHDFFSTRNQEEWKKHLRNERLIDLEMLQMQVNFSTQEGGFDTFVNFKDENDFLRKFFAMTLDTEKAEEARRLVVEVCEKHHRRPEYQARKDQLVAFRDSLNVFALASRSYLDACATQASLVIEAARLSVQLAEDAALLDVEQGKDREYEGTQRAILTLSLETASKIAREHATTTRAWHEAKVAATTASRDETAGQVSGLENKVLFVRAARLHKDIIAAQVRLKELEGMAEAQQEQLQPVRDHLEIQGALLRAALLDEEKKAQDVLTGIEERDKERESQKKEKRATAEAASKRAGELQQEKTRLEDAEARRARRLGVLTREGVLAREDEPAEQAYHRTSSEMLRAATERDTSRSNRTKVLADARSKREGAAAKRNEAATLLARADATANIVARGEAERERLSQHPQLLNAAQTERVDPFAPVLAQLLTEAAADLSRQIAEVDVRVADLKLTREAIESTQVAGYSPDVAHVVKILRQQGIKSATAFNEYIAKTVPDAFAARVLVNSDPARFLGVSVASGEFHKVRDLDWTGRCPQRPIVVSVQSLDAAAEASQSTVVPAENDAAFNVPAAQLLAADLDVRLEAEQRRRAELDLRLQDTLRVDQDLKQFLQTFGDGKLAQSQSEEALLRQNTEAAKTQAESLDQEADDLDLKSADLEQQQHEAASRYNDLVQAAKRLAEFVQEHEAERDMRLERLSQLPADIEEQIEAEAIADEGLAVIQQEHEADVHTKAAETERLKALAKERGSIGFCNKEWPARKQLQESPRPLDVLRLTYKDALDTFETDEKQRLGTLRETIRAARDTEANKKNEFQRDFLGVKLSDMQPFVNIEHETAIRQTESKLTLARTALTSAEADLKVEQGELRKFLQFKRELLDTASEALKKLSIEELQATRSALDTLLADETDKQVKAKKEADTAQCQADEKKEKAEKIRLAETALKTPLNLPERPDLELIATKALAEIGIALEIPTGKVVVEYDASAQVARLVREHARKAREVGTLREMARDKFDGLKRAASAEDFVRADAAVSDQMQQNRFEDTCRDATRLLEHLDDRIATTQSTLEGMEKDFNAALEEVTEVVRRAVRTLAKASSEENCVPLGVPYVGGRQILKLGSQISKVTVEAQRTTMRMYLESLISSKSFPARGTDLVAEAVMRICGGRLRLQVLKMARDESEQYVLVDKISNSGGEGVVMAMFLYVLVSQLRADNYARIQKSAGGPLLLDNPFAKVTSAAMWQAQRAVARSVGVQLVFLTAVEDYNALGEFERFVRLRKPGRNAKSGRWHMEAANYHAPAEEDVVE
ncbi:hypothetical protein [Variovorax sp. dw_954]|uniref:hypothetical protein n=1 Tax=Variovorax sp. dw_954 TaxID=2720078 RepID=UPI001BD1DDAC|nr:hypothetical protein [Variovorax sp. dw_954]